MCAQEHQMLWSKDVLDGIVLSAVFNPERFRPQLLQKRDDVIYWISLYSVDDVVNFLILIRDL